MNNTEDAPGWRSAGVKDFIGAGINREFANAMTSIGAYWSANTNGSNDIVFLRTARYGKAQSEWQALAVDVQIVIQLATPITYQLTPQEVETLLGVNNIWADCGDTSVTYRADTKLYIQQLTKPTEDDMTANAAITSGKFFMINNRLFLATAAIASGAMIIPGTNCTELSLADALNNINA